MGEHQIRVGPADAQAIMEQLSRLPLWVWRYRWEQAPTRHVGPFAEDFMAAFELDADDRLINPQDAVGVLLVAVQALTERSLVLSARIARLEGSLDLPDADDTAEPAIEAPGPS